MTGQQAGAVGRSITHISMALSTDKHGGQVGPHQLAAAVWPPLQHNAVGKKRRTSPHGSVAQDLRERLDPFAPRSSKMVPA